MEDAELLKRLDTLEQKIDATGKSAEKTRKYILGFVIMSVAGFLLPLIGLVIAIPQFLDLYKNIGSF